MGDNNESQRYKRSPQTGIKQNAFLKAFVEVGVITAAAEAAGIERTTHYQWLREDPDYPAKFQTAVESANDSLEQEAIKRGKEGWDEPVYQGGKLVGHIRKRSDTLLIFMLKGNKPEKHRERIEHSGEMRQVVEIVQFDDNAPDSQKDTPAE